MVFFKDLELYYSLSHFQTGQKIASLPKNGLSVKVCKFSPNSEMLVTAGDDEKPTIWNIMKKAKIA